MPSLRSPLLLLLRVNFLQGWRHWRAIQAQSRLLSSVMFLFLTGYLTVAFWLFRQGLGFLRSFPGLGVLLTERLLFLLFAFLFGLLLLSNLVISHTHFFRHRETAFLFSLPVSAPVIFRWKFLESTLLASWAFIFLIAPLLAAYGLTQRAPWHFYPATLGLIALFVILPGLAGAWLAIHLARFWERRAFQVLMVFATILLSVGVMLWLKSEPVSDEIMETRVLAIMDKLLEKTNFAHFSFLPSYWLAQSVLQWAEGSLRAAFFFIGVLLSYVLFFGWLIYHRMGGQFYDAFSRAHSRAGTFYLWPGRQPRPQGQNRFFDYPNSFAENVLQRFTPLASGTRALALKDLRVFWRDTTQWGQTAVLFGLLGVYIINLRHFSQQLTSPFWVHLVSYLNLGACALNLATLTTRFVFPQFSLEGKRLWIVGMAPIGLVKVVQTKFWLAGISSSVLAVGLISFSSSLLDMPVPRTVYFSMAIVVMAFALNAMAIGLGTLYPNLKEENPSKIVSGFGGTFCLILSFFYIAASVLLLALGSPWGWKGVVSLPWSILSWSGFGLLSALVGWLPLQMGLRRVARFEL